MILRLILNRLTHLNDNTLLPDDSVIRSTTEKSITQTSTTTESVQRAPEISRNEVIVSNIVLDDKARKSAPKNDVSNNVKPAESPKSKMSAAYNNLVSVTSTPLTATSTLPIPPVTATNLLSSTTVPPTPSVNTSLLVTRSGYSFPDIPDPLGIIETMIGAEWYDKSYRTRIDGYKWYLSPPYLHLLLHYDDKIDLLHMFEPTPTVLDDAYKNITITPEGKKRFYES